MNVLRNTSPELQQMRDKQEAFLNSVLQYCYQIFAVITLLSGFFCLSNTYIVYKLDYKIIIIYCCIATFLVMVHKILGSNFTQNCCFNIFESLLFILYLLSIVYYMEIERVNINFISYAQLVLQFIILTVTVLISRGSSDEESAEQSQQVQDILMSAFKCIGALQLVFISLRLTDSISWSWIQTLIITWFFLGLGFVSAIFLLLDLIQKYRSKNNIREEKRQQIIIGGMWLSVVSLGLSVIPYLTVLGLAISEDYKFYHLNQYAFCVTIIYYIFQFCFYFRNKRVLIDYFLTYDVVDNEDRLQTRNQQQDLQIDTENRAQLRGRQRHRISISKVPQFMVKLSQTFYKSVQSNEKSQILQMVQQKKTVPQDQNVDNFNESKRFDTLMSSPRQLDVSENNGQDQTTQKIGNQQLEEMASTYSQQKKQLKLCLVCYEKESNMINQPCGHGGFCRECCEQLFNKSDLCYLCRKKVTHSLLTKIMDGRESIVEVVEVVESKKNTLQL